MPFCQLLPQQLLFLLNLARQRPLQPIPIHGEAEMDFELRRVSEFLLAVTFSILGALIQARKNGGESYQVLLLDLSLLASLLSIASSALHLELHRHLSLPLARLFLRLAAFFVFTAVALSITSTISPSLRRVPFAVFFSTQVQLQLHIQE